MFGEDLARRVFGIGTDPCSIARSCVQAMNARDFDALHPLLSRNFVYTDPADQTFEGRDDFLLALRIVLETIPGLALQVDSYSRRGEGCLLNGSLTADDARHCTSSLWEMRVQNHRLVSLAAYQRSNTLHLVQFARAAKEATVINGQAANPA